MIDYEESVSENRYKIVRVGMFWRIKIGDGEALYGRFVMKNSAWRMACLLRREFLNGAFVANERNQTAFELRGLLGDKQSSGPQGHT